VPLKRYSGNLWRSTKESGLGGGPGEEYSPIEENWGRDGAEMGLERRERKGEEWDDVEGSEDGPGEEGTLSSTSC